MGLHCDRCFITKKLTFRGGHDGEWHLLCDKCIKKKGKRKRRRKKEKKHIYRHNILEYFFVLLISFLVYILLIRWYKF